MALRLRDTAFAIVMGVGAAAPVAAQIALPPLQTPNLPILQQLPAEVGRTADGALDAADPRRLREVRKLRIHDLLRTNRRTFEADPRGALALRSEVVAFAPSAAALDRARGEGFEVLRTHPLEGLDTTVVVLRAPQGMSTRHALRQLRERDPEGVYDFNHVYLENGEIAAGSAPAQPPVAADAAAPMASTVKVGLIDGGVAAKHPVFSASTLQQHGCAEPVPTDHGTAVASLMAGLAEGFHGAAPGAQLYVADVYCGAVTGGAVDAIAEAFGWLSREKVPVINISLVGPPNAMLEQIVRIVVARGHIVVAAAGNDGPSAPPLYPAAYAGVVAVTAVGANRRVLLEACRGAHVAFAAPGAGMSAAAATHPYQIVRGTSFAAPIVAGLLALHVKQPDRESASAVIAALAAQAIDLGARGRDPVYGHGLVGETARMPGALAAAPLR